MLHQGSGQAAPTCQIWPPDFPGYQRYCPYTSGLKDGFWHGPDLTTAERLADQSGTTHIPVTVWNWGSPAVASYVVQVLRQLGYRATLRQISYKRFFTLPAPTVRKIQIGFTAFRRGLPHRI